MMTIEQLLYFDNLRNEYSTNINVLNNQIFSAQQVITSTEKNIKETKEKMDLMVSILNQQEPDWADRLSAYYAQD